MLKIAYEALFCFCYFLTVWFPDVPLYAFNNVSIIVSKIILFLKQFYFDSVSGFSSHTVLTFRSVILNRGSVNPDLTFCYSFLYVVLFVFTKYRN